MKSTLIWVVVLLMIWGVAPAAVPLNAQDVPDDLPYIRTAEDISAALSLIPPEGESFNEYTPFNRTRSDNTPASHFVIPRTIKVGLTRSSYSGWPGCSAWVNAGMPVGQVVEMPFSDYVKNVLPNEWIHTWHPNSLRAGAMAAKTFAWWKMTLRGTQWQRPRGADVVDNTCDQVFIANSQRASTNSAVDETWWYRMSRDNLIKNVHYLDQDWRCTSTPSLRPCMGQWGSQYKALDGWGWQAILQHYYGPTWIQLLNDESIPANTNVILNGNFAQGLDHWGTWGGVAEDINTESNVLRFYRSAGSANPAVILQNLPWMVYNDSPLRLQFNLGNSTPQSKIFTVHIHDGQWTNPISCQVSVPPNSPLLSYTLRAVTTTAWSALRVEIVSESADDLPYQLVSNIRLQYRPGDADRPNECVEPRPGKPGISAPTANDTVPGNFTLSVIPGASNFRVGYTPAYHVQISTQANFGSLAYENTASPTTDITPNLPKGDYYARVRQFDGIDRWSNWSDSVAFKVRNFPAVPLILSPVGDIDGVSLANAGFMWTHDAGSLEYRISLFDSNGVRLNRVRFNASAANCVASTCQYPSGAFTPLMTSKAVHSWMVESFNAEAKSASVPVNFTPLLPGVPLAVSPADGESPSGAILFTWRHTPLAHQYVLRIIAPNGNDYTRLKLTPQEANCSPDTCQLSSDMLERQLKDGRTYQWFVVAKSQEPKGKGKSERRSVTFNLTP